MPFNSSAYSFDEATIKTVNRIGGVYGLFYPSTRPGFFVCLYVGRTDNLRRRLSEHLSDPPIAGATHFFAEAFVTERERAARETELITEFKPPGNKVS